MAVQEPAGWLLIEQRGPGSETENPFHTHRALFDSIDDAKRYAHRNIRINLMETDWMPARGSLDSESWVALDGSFGVHIVPVYIPDDLQHIGPVD